MTFQPAEAYFIAEDLRQCVMNELGCTIGGIEGMDSCVTHGQITWDNCCPGSVRVAIVRQYASDRFPDPLLRPTNCDAVERATDIRVLVLRCAPNPNADGQMPTCEQLDKTARVGAEDMDALWRAAACCLSRPDQPFPYVVRDVSPVGPRGACYGTQLNLTVGLVNWCHCCG